MAENPRLTPIEYLDRFFDELRAEVRANPRLAARLVKALGGEVVFEDAAKEEVANPYQLAASSSKAKFLKVFSSFKLAQLKQVLKEHNLATKVDMTGKSIDQLLEMLYERAASKVSERKSSIF